jgi:hypothetical protein
MNLLLPLFSVVLLYSCSEPKKPNTGIEIYDTDIEEIIDVTASFEVIADSIALPEGPVWDDSNQRLLFVDCLNDQLMKTAIVQLDDYLLKRNIGSQTKAMYKS